MSLFNSGGGRILHVVYLPRHNDGFRCMCRDRRYVCDSLSKIVFLGLAVLFCWESSAAHEKIGQASTLGHRAPVTMVEISNDENFVASLSSDGCLIVWDGRTSEVLWQLDSNVLCIGIQKDTNRLVAVERMSGQGGKGLRLSYYCLVNGRKSRTATRIADDVATMAFSRNADRLVVALDTGYGELKVPLRMWNVSSGELVWRDNTYGIRATAIGLDATGRFVQVGFSDGLCAVVDTLGQRCPEFFSGHTSPVTSIERSLDGKWLAAGAREGTILWNASFHDVCHRTKHSTAAFAIPENMWLASSSRIRLELFDSPPPARIRGTFSDPTGFSTAKFTCCGKVVTGSYGGGVTLWDRRSGNVLRRFGANTGVPRCAVFCPDGSRLLAGYSSNIAILWDVLGRHAATVLQANKADTNQVLSVDISNDGRKFVTGHGNGVFESACVWDGCSLDRISEIPIQLGTGTKGQIEFLPSGNKLLLGDGICDITRHEFVWRFHDTHARHAVAACNMSRDGKHVYLAGTRYGIEGVQFGFLARCDAHSGRVIHYQEFGGRKRRTTEVCEVDRLALRDDGQELVAKFGMQWKVLNGVTLEVVQKVKLPAGSRVECVAYYDRDIILGLSDGTLWLYDVRSNRRIRQFVAHNGPITCVACDPSQGRFISGSLDKRLILWDFVSGKIIKTLSGNVVGNMTIQATR